MDATAEGATKAFMKHQMTSILAPFADNAQEMQAQLNDHSEELGRLNKVIADFLQELGLTNNNLTNVRDEARNNFSRINSLKDSLDRAHRHRGQLDEELSRTNSKVQSIDHDLQALLETCKDLRRDLTATHGEGRNCQGAVDLLRREHGEIFRSGLSKALLGVQGLGARLDEHNNDIVELKRGQERTDTSLHQAHHTLELDGKAHALLKQEFETLVNRFDGVNCQVEESVRKLAAQGELLESAGADLRLNRLGLENLDAATHALQLGQTSHETQLTDLTNRFNIMSNDHAIHKQFKHKSEMLHTEMANAIDAHDKKSDAFHETLRQMSTRMNIADQHTDALINKTNQMSDNLDATANRLSDLTKSHRKATSCIQSLNHELDKTNANVRTTTENIEETTKATHIMKADMGTTGVTMTRMAQSLNEAHGQFGGMKAGLQDTQAHVAAEGMVPVKIRSSRASGIMNSFGPVEGNLGLDAAAMRGKRHNFGAEDGATDFKSMAVFKNVRSSLSVDAPEFIDPIQEGAKTAR